MIVRWIGRATALLGLGVAVLSLYCFWPACTWNVLQLFGWSIVGSICGWCSFQLIGIGLTAATDEVYEDE